MEIYLTVKLHWFFCLRLGFVPASFSFSPFLVLPNPTHLKMLAALLQITGFACMIDYRQSFTKA